MVLRFVYLIVGLAIGISVGVIWTTKNPPARPAITDAELLMPAQIKAGHNQPRKIFVDENLLSIPLNWSWNYLPGPDEHAHGMSNWLYYGAVDDRDETFMLGYITPGKLGLRSGGVRDEIADQGIFKRKNINLKFFGDDRHLTTRHGKATLATFSYRYNGLHKICLAFQLTGTDRDRQYEGFLCSGLGEVPNDAHLACLLNSIKIYDSAYWIEPDSGKAERKRCQFEPRRNMMDVSVAKP